MIGIQVAKTRAVPAQAHVGAHRYGGGRVIGSRLHVLLQRVRRLRGWRRLHTFASVVWDGMSTKQHENQLAANIFAFSAMLAERCRMYAGMAGKKAGAECRRTPSPPIPSAALPPASASP